MSPHPATPGPARAVAALLLNALVFGLSWWPFRALQQHGLHPLWTTALTFWLALGCLLLLRPGALAALWRYPPLWTLTLASGLSTVGFNWAMTVGDVVRVILLFYLMPLWAVLLAWPLLRERPSLGSVLRLALAFTGVVIVLKTPGSPWPLPHSLADVLALLAGLCFALTNVLLRKFNRAPEDARMAAMFGGAALLAVLAAGLGLAQGLIAAPPAPRLDWGVLALATSLVILAANLALQYGAARLRASTTALIMLSEVLFASVSSVLLGAGQLSGRTLLGGALILLASVLAVLPLGRRRVKVPYWQSP